jgi:hypothetical protein
MSQQIMSAVEIADDTVAAALFLSSWQLWVILCKLEEHPQIFKTAFRNFDLTFHASGLWSFFK